MLKLMNKKFLILAEKKRDPVDALFSSFFDDFLRNENHTAEPLMSSFRVNITEEGDGFRLIAEMPGFKTEDIEISYIDGYLTIRAQRSVPISEDETYIRREIRDGYYSRSFYIDGIDRERIKSQLNEGLLIVTVPKNQ